ncbi:MAG: PAS domain-containing sensor histidine kinase [Hyphomicrobiales bacterium]|nr:PAS domain-containing sensor histidine kinase [Hyphomicrobiales bacterium]
MRASGGKAMETGQSGALRDPGFSVAAHDRLFAEPAVADAHTRGDPILVIHAEPLHVVYASASAAAMMDAATPGALTATLAAGDRAAWERLEHLARQLAPRPNPQMERLRLPVAGAMRQITLLCRRFITDDDKAALLLIAPGLDGPWRHKPQAAEPFDAPADEVESAAKPAGDGTPAHDAGPGEADTPASQRFVWRADFNHRLTHLSPEGSTALGLGEDAWRGKSWAEIIADAAAGADLGRHLEKTESWSHEPVRWSPALWLALGATPLFKPVRQFAGWRGFGVVQHAQPESASAPDDVAATPEAPHHDEADTAGLAASEAAEIHEAQHSLPDEPALQDNGNHVPTTGAEDAAEVAAVEPLTAAEARAFNEIGEKLSPQLAATAAPVPIDDAAASPAAPPVAADAAGRAGLLDMLPLGLLVARGGETLFINKPLLQHAGLADTAELDAAGGADQLTARLAAAQGMMEASDEGEPGEEGRMFQLRQIIWQGEPASLLATWLSPAADSARASHRAAEAEARDLRAILDTATDGVVTLDANAHVLSLNKSAEALFGCDGADCIGHPFANLLHRDGQAAFAGYFSGVTSNGVASLMNDGREIAGRTAKGGHIPLFMTLGRIGTPEEPRYCGVLRDMTQWKKVEAELNEARQEAERASAIKSEFLARISHEIRTPLGAILGFSEVMSEERLGPVGNERYREYLKDIHASGQHVMSLVNDLLDLSKIESGKLEMSFTSVDINHIAEECIMLMQPVAAREHVVLRRSLAANLPPVVADERSLRQIMLNVLSNAIKFNVSSGQVIVSTALTDSGHAVLRVRDTGTGMSEEDVQLAMEPFRQLPNAAQKRGTGLGLPITRALIEANRASLVIRSRPNEGTMVEIAFPPTRVLAE